MKPTLNDKIKRRESFRPFAPSVMEEAVAEWFEEDDSVPFMMQVFQVDLDAPDLCDGPLSPSAVDGSLKPTDDQLRLPPPRPGNGHDRRGRKGDTPITLDAGQSAALREKLLVEVGNITSADLAAAWARDSTVTVSPTSTSS